MSLTGCDSMQEFCGAKAINSIRIPITMRASTMEHFPSPIIFLERTWRCGDLEQR